MTGILPLVTATALAAFAAPPRTVWRQVEPARRSSVGGQAADEAGPLGGTIDDPLPSDYQRSGRELPGPVLRPALPVEGDETAGDDTLPDVIQRGASRSAGLRDVIGPVKRAAATRPVKPEEPLDKAKPRNSSTERKSAEEPEPEPDAVEPDAQSPEDTTGPAFPQQSQSNPNGSTSKQSKRLASKKEEPLPDEPRVPPDSDNPDASEKLAMDDKNEKGGKPGKHVSPRTDSTSDADALPQSSQASGPSAGTLVGLFASLGANVFLLWVATSQRSRYRALVRRTFDHDLTSDNADPHNEPQMTRLPNAGESDY
jgi:hypothetical protein